MSFKRKSYSKKRSFHKSKGYRKGGVKRQSVRIARGGIRM